MNRIRLKQNSSFTFQEAFNLLKPQTEVYLRSEKHKVQGYIDAIQDVNGEVSLMDYKTSRSDQISDEFKLQLAIYALLYNETYGKYPALVGIDFLKYGPKYLKVDGQLLEMAKKECKLIQEKTLTEDIKDYPRNASPLCKWNGGQCDFYDMCFGQKKVEDFKN
jgi:CRISPR/Cas system-associated exonuclease Cas4 (RecB family)